MLRPASEMAAVAEEAARVQAEKDAAKAERFVRDTASSAIEAAAALGRTQTAIIGEELPCSAACEIAVRLLTEAGYAAKYDPPVTLDLSMGLVSSTPFRPGSLTIRWGK